MRTNEPETAEYFARAVGTRQSIKFTERQRAGALGKEKTGDSSLREVEEFIHHPNLFKRELGTGDAVVVVPLVNRSHAVLLKFHMLPDLPAQGLPLIQKSMASLLDPPKQARKGEPEAKAEAPQNLASADTLQEALQVEV